MTDIHDHIAVLLLFFVVHLLTGLILIGRTGRRLWLWNAMDSAAVDIARRLNREGRSDSDRIVRGTAVFLVMTLLAYGAGWLWTYAAAGAWGWAWYLILLVGSVTVMTPIAVLRAVAKRLAEHKDQRVRDILAPYVREDLRQADHYALVRKAVEYGADALCVHLVGPSLFFALFGAPGLFVYTAVMAQQRVFGQLVPAHIHFGATARAAERLLNFVPALLSAALVAIGAAVVSRGQPLAALKLPLAQARLYDSFNRGLVLAAAAGGLGMTLGGPRRLTDGQISRSEWLGPAGTAAKAEPAAVRRAGMIIFVAFLCLILAFSFLSMIRL